VLVCGDSGRREQEEGSGFNFFNARNFDENMSAVGEKNVKSRMVLGADETVFMAATVFVEVGNEVMRTSSWRHKSSYCSWRLYLFL